MLVACELLFQVDEETLRRIVAATQASPGKGGAVRGVDVALGFGKVLYCRLNATQEPLGLTHELEQEIARPGSGSGR